MCRVLEANDLIVLYFKVIKQLDFLFFIPMI